ncbi:MAG: hypothetical protein AB1Z55_03415 [Acidimicrobiia bacterium]
MTDWRKALDHLRSDAAAIAALDVLAGMPLLTASPPARATGRSEAAISDAIDHLVGAGIASERTPNAGVAGHEVPAVFVRTFWRGLTPSPSCDLVHKTL